MALQGRRRIPCCNASMPYFLSPFVKRPQEGRVAPAFEMLSMMATLHHSLVAFALITLIELAVIARILLRPHRDPASRIAWVVVVGVLPMVGMFAYLLLGEVSIGRRRVARLHAVLERMPPFLSPPAGDVADLAATAHPRALPASL